MFHFQNSFLLYQQQQSTPPLILIFSSSLPYVRQQSLEDLKHSPPIKNLLSFTHSLKDLNDETVKTKLDACLFGLRTINDKFKKGIFPTSPSQSKTNSLTPIQRNTLKPLQSSTLPRISYQQYRQGNQSRKFTNQNPVMTQNSYLNCSNEFSNSFILMERLNYTCLSMGRSFNSSMDLAKSILPKMVNQKLLETSAINSNNNNDKNTSFNISIKKKTRFGKYSSSNTLQNQKKLFFPPKIKKRLYQPASGKTLSKQNRYFPSNPTPINPTQIQKMGLYQSSNRYRRDFISQQMNNLSPKIQKKQLEFVKVCKQNELFLTRPKQLEPTELDEFLKGEFVISEAKPKKYLETVKTEELEKELTRRQAATSSNLNNNNNNKQPKNLTSNQNQLSTISDPIAEDYNQQLLDPTNSITYFQIHNYQIVKNASYLKFRMSNIEIWEQVYSLLAQIITFVKQLKISTCRFKANNLLQYWSGKKLSTKEIQKILKITKKSLISKQKTAIQSVLSILYAKRKMKSIIQAKAKRLSYIKWVSDRITGIRAIKKQTSYKLKKAHQIHQQLFDGQYQWDTQIYLSSFSQNPFVRTTTQYMQSFENMFTHMWKQSSKHMILVIPTINSQILQSYQQKLKIKRSVTLICPEVHELFPVNMSLAGCLLFSYEALNKIRQLIKGKKAIIIPGKYSSPKYELLISEFLRTPLMTSLKPRRDLQFQKEIFSAAHLSVLPFISIRENTSIDEIIRNFAKLLLSHKEINKWVFKINGEFGGRGLATFCMKSSKVLKSILSSCKDTIKPLQEYLKRNLKLKLKINFQNSLFMLGDYLQRLAQKGGIIQQQKEQIQSYQISFFIENKLTCTLVSSFKCFTVSHSNKAFIYQPYPNPKISSILPKLKSILSKNDYLGYVSVNLIIAGDTVYGIEIKPYLTQLTSVEPFIKTIQSKRQLRLNLDGRRGEKLQNEMISDTLRNELMIEKNYKYSSTIQNNNSHIKQSHNNKLPTQQSHLFSHINMSSTQLQTVRPIPNDCTYLFIPNIILTDVPIPKKAEFIQSLIIEQFSRPKFDILSNNLVLYLSNGLSLSLLIIGKQVRKIKKTAIEVVRGLSEKTGVLKIYCGKNEARDVFQFGDIIKAVTQIKG